MRMIFALVGLVLMFCTANAVQLDPRQVRTTVDLGQLQPDTIIISTRERLLFYKTQAGRLLAYRVAVGSEAMSWSGVAVIQKVAQWPDWVPPPDMLKRKPFLPKRIAGGWGNPLGAYALYLFQGGRDTLYRIHGTNNSESIGQAITSGCIRLTNDDIMELAAQVRVGTNVVVLK